MDIYIDHGAGGFYVHGYELGEWEHSQGKFIANELIKGVKYCIDDTISTFKCETKAAAVFIKNNLKAPVKEAGFYEKVD